MKKLFVLCVGMLFSLLAHATSFTEGDYYEVLSSPKSSTPLVSEYFSFFCPHCFTFEPLIKELKKTLPENTQLQKNQVSFMGGAMGPSLSKAYATMIALGIEDKMAPIMFKRIQVENNPPRNDADIRQLFIEQGVSAKDFDATFNGFAVDSMARRFDKGFNDAGLRGVPAVVVNNKYLVKMDKIESQKQYFELVNYLLKLK